MYLHTCTHAYIRIQTKLVKDIQNGVSILPFSQVGRSLVTRGRIWFLALETMGKCLGKRHTKKKAFVLLDQLFSNKYTTESPGKRNKHTDPRAPSPHISDSTADLCHHRPIENSLLQWLPNVSKYIRIAWRAC